jgi:hypothetical protein
MRGGFLLCDHWLQFCEFTALENCRRCRALLSFDGNPALIHALWSLRQDEKNNNRPFSHDPREATRCFTEQPDNSIPCSLKVW